jgi:AraC-like DNA-binding protein
MEINRVEFSQLNVSLFAGISYTLMPILIFTFPEILYGIPRANKTHLKSESKKNKSSSKKLNTQVLIGTSPDFEDPFQETSQKIISYLHEKKPYLNPKFKIDDLVNDLQIPKHHIYYCFNNVLNEKFTTIRNNLRIEHSKTALLSDQLKLMTVEAIGMSSGFASKSNFFAIFGNFTSGTLTGINADIRPAGGTLNMAFAMTGTTGSPSTAVAGTHSRTIPAGIVAGDWFAMGSVYQTSGASNRAEIFGGSQFVARDMSGFVTPKRNHTTIGLRIGHANTTSSYSTLAREIAEFIVWNRALTNAEIVDAAYRAQVRQAGFGRVVKL